MSATTTATYARTAPEDAASADPSPDLLHTWVVAATIRVTEKVAKHAELRGSFFAEIETLENGNQRGMRINALEVYCEGCRRPMDEVAGAPCAAKVNNEHLIGGDQSQRKKRKVYRWDRTNATPVKAPTIQRRGIEAVVRREA